MTWDERLERWWNGVTRPGWFALWTLVLLVALTFAVVLWQVRGRGERLQSALATLESLGANRDDLRWLPDDPRLPRRLEAFRRDEIRETYLRSLEEITFASLSGDGSGLRSYFQGAALEDARLATSSAPGALLVTWQHRIKLRFYAPDGATVAFTDSAWVAESLAPGDTRVYWRAMDTVLKLDDGNWRVHHWRVLETREPDTTPPVHANLGVSLSEIRGINYVGRDRPFAAFWEDEDVAQVRSSFSAMAQLRLNTVRVFVPYPMPAAAPRKLRIVLHEARRQGLRVIVTLLDGYTRYRLEDVPGITRDLEKLMPSLRDAAVLAIDLKNEAERDAKRASWERIRDQLRLLAGWLRTNTTKPLTAGLSEPDAALSDSLDFVTLHHYGSLEALQVRHAQALRSGKPILLEEFGFHTQVDKLPDPHTEGEQARHYAAILEWTKGERIGWLAWTLHDFPRGAVPDNRGVERWLGLMRADGTFKPAARVVLGEAAPQWSVEEWLMKVSVLRRVWPWLVLIVALLLGGWWRWRRSGQRPARVRV
jgi:hypothetical protein